MNLVHTYVECGTFKSVYGGSKTSLYGSITHLTHLPHSTLAKWPWMQDMWHLGNADTTVSEFHDSLEDAKDAAVKKWPDCIFKARIPSNTKLSYKTT